MREKRVELITFVLWVVLLAVFITAAVIIIFFSTNEYIFQNCADMFVLCAALLFGISGFVKLKFIMTVQRKNTSGKRIMIMKSNGMMKTTELSDGKGLRLLSC